MRADAVIAANAALSGRAAAFRRCPKCESAAVDPVLNRWPVERAIYVPERVGDVQHASRRSVSAELASVQHRSCA
jgi:hypothetical protein